MTESEKTEMKDWLAECVRVTVNGKLDKIQLSINEHNKVHEADMKTILPIVQGITGLKIVGTLLTWGAGIAVGWAAIKGYVVK